MSSTKVFKDAESIYQCTLRYMGKGPSGVHAVGHSCYSFGLPRFYRKSGYVPCWNVDIGTLHRRSYDYPPTKGDVLYVEPKARITRDLLRNSGFKITLSREKADLIVFPEISDWTTYTYDMVGYNTDTKTLYFFTIRDKNIDWFTEDFNGEIKQAIIDYAKNICRGGISPEDAVELYHKPNFRLGSVTFIPPIESYFEIFEDTYPDRKYVQDNYVEFEPASHIGIETLEVWSHLEDKTILEKCIISSDWMDYPLTLRTFLKAEKDELVYDMSNRNIKMVLGSIHYYDSDEEYSSLLVSPKDWNMLQKWILYRMGVEQDKSSYINSDVFWGLNECYRPYVRSAFAVAPLNISEHETICNLKQKAKLC